MSDRREWILRIEGMTCDHCATTVDAALTGVPGVHAATTRYADGEVRILTVGDVDGAALAAAVARRGYRVVGQAARPVDDDAATAWRGVDLAVVGSGAAGFAAAIRAAERGARVAIVEAGVLGGTCVNVGCVPSKTMIRAAEAMHRAGHHGFAGVRTWAERPDLASIVAQKDALVDALRTTKYEDVLTAYPAISLVRGRARLRRDGGLDVDGRSLGAGKVVVATGAAPWAPPIPGLAEAGYLTSTDALALTELPRRLVVLGGGAVGLEVAQTFARLGTAVTVLEVQPRLVPGEDAEVGDALVGYLRDEGLEVALGAVIQRVGGGPGGYRIDVVVDGAPRTLATEQLLVAAGRRPRTSGLGLADAGVQTGARGEVVVDVYLETTRPGVFAAGDVIGEPALVYLAAHAGALAADNALGGEARRYEVTAVPRVTFTDPAVASVGLTEAAARARGADVVVSRLPMAYVPRALAAHDTRGFVKLVADRVTRRLLGAHVLAPDGGELIQAAALAIRFGIRVDELAATLFPYLTASEALKLACQAFTRDLARLSCCAA